MGLSNKILLTLTFFGLMFADSAQALVINTTVPGESNLYFDTWGPSYAGATGAGIAPVAVSYTFSSGQALDVTAGGCVIDAGRSCTGPAGHGWTFRGLPVYSLIGVWSSDALSINPVGAGAFYIGPTASLVAPVATGGLYLFMAENDGVFRDNARSYTVAIQTKAQAVPEPATLMLMGLGLVGIGFASKRKSP